MLNECITPITQQWIWKMFVIHTEVIILHAFNFIVLTNDWIILLTRFFFIYTVITVLGKYFFYSFWFH